MTDPSVIIRAMPRIAARDRPQLVETRRTQILDAALEILSTKGFSQTSVEEIARAAKLAKGSVYLYFPNKAAILDALVQRHSLLPDLAMLETTLASIPLEAGLRTLLPVLWLRLRERKDFARLMLREGLGVVENGHLFVERVILPTNRLLAGWLAAQLGEERAKEIDTFVAARALVGMLLVFFVSQEVLGGADIHPIDNDAITKTVADVFLRGVLGKEAGGS